jgi:hypothetical protein
MREADECGEVQMSTNAGSFVRRPWLLFDDLLGEGVPQEHIDLLLEMRRLERAGECPGRRGPLSRAAVGASALLSGASTHQR